MMRRRVLLIAILVAGCVAPNRELDRPVTKVDPRQANIQYWLDQPATVSVKAKDFEALWAACERALRDRMFKIDRQAPRGGLMTTEPLISKQFFELWRTDAVTVADIGHSSLSTMRRTARFEIRKHNDGSFSASPKVIVEQQVSAERQIPSAGQYTMAFGGERVIGTRESDLGQQIAPDYWYAQGRDEALERDLARSVERLLRR